jgi:hypothetical protein
MRCEPVCSDSLCLTGALFNARSGHVKEQSLILCHCDNQLQSLLNAENSVVIAAAIAKDMAMHVMQHLVVTLRIARPRFQAIHTAASNYM